MTPVIEERPVAAPTASNAVAASATPASHSLSPTPKEFLSLRLGGEEYGIDILKVQEIRSYEPPTRIANAPEFLKGVINLRGVIVPIIDLRVKFGCAAERMLILLDIESLMSSGELGLIEAVTH